MTPLQTQFPITFITRNSSQFTYYVDSVNGDDGNTGTSAAQALATLDALPELVAGQSIGLSCGSTWYEQLTLTVDNVRIGVYGTGDKPVLDCSDAFTNWEDSTDRADANTNVYSKSIPFVSYDGATFVNVFEDGAFMVRASSLANCQATAGTYWTSSSNPTTTTTLYIHPTGSTDPDANDKVYRVPVRAHGIDARSVSGTIVDGIRAQRSFHQGGSVKVGDDSIVRNCDLLYGNSHNVFLSEGSLLEDCTIKYQYYGTSANSFIVFNKNILTGKAITARRCVVGEDTYNNLAVGIYCHHNTSGSFGALTLEDMTWQNIAIGITAYHIASGTVARNTFTDCEMMSRLDEPDKAWAFTDYVYTNTRDSGNQRLLSITAASPAATGITATLSGGEFTSKRASNAAIYVQREGNKIELNNCIFDLTTNQTAPQGIWFNAVTTGSLIMNDTRFIGDYWQSQIVLPVGVTYEDSDDNCFDGQYGFSGQFGGNSYNNIANWRIATGQDGASAVGACAA